jgi:hypothetical protein
MTAAMSQSTRLAPQAATRPPHDERRAWVRHACNFPTACQPITSGRDVRWSGHVDNVSRGGVKLVVSRRFEPGTLLQIDLQEGRANAPSSFLARVVHVGSRGGGLWAMGCAFLHELSEDECRALLDG